MMDKKITAKAAIILIWIVCTFWSSSAAAITIDELADICKTMESTIRDITVEYEWINIPPNTIEEAEAEMGVPVLVSKDGIVRYKLSAMGLLPHRDPNDPNSPLLPDRVLSEESTTIMDRDGHIWDSLTKESYNGRTRKRLHIGGWPRKVRTGSISNSKHFMLPMNLTPFGFSVFRFRFSKASNNKPISVVLKELGRIDNNIEKINEFNTIRADVLQEVTKQVCARVYFSVDHGYTPVRYEYTDGPNKVGLVFDVNSLEKVADGLWFPSSGTIRVAGENHVNKYAATSKIVVNQELTDEHFDIEFPPGTRVDDEISGTSYVFHPTEGKLNQQPTDESYPCSAMNMDRADVAAQSEAVDTNSVEAILTQLKQKTTNLTSYRAELEYRFKQPLLESETLRKGVLYYQKSDEKSMLRVNFQTLKQDDEKERKYSEHFIFDGIWLIRIDYQIKKAERRQLAEPNKPADPFELASRDLPVIGFTKIEDLKKQFEIKLVQQNKDEAKTSFHLHLKVKPDSTYKDWPAIDLWIDKKSYLPAKIIALTTEEDIYEIKFLKPMVNKKIDAKVFKFDIPKDFTIEIIPLKKQPRTNCISAKEPNLDRSEIMFRGQLVRGVF